MEMNEQNGEAHMGKTVPFAVDGRSSTAYLAHPEQDEGPPVLVLHAWWGLTDTFKSVCDWLAAEGFVALAPDLYHGQTAGTIEDAERLSRTLDHERAFEDVLGAVGFINDQPAVRGSAIGVIGFSLGSYFALQLKAPAAAIVTFYGLCYPDRVTGNAAFLGHFAEQDEYESADVMRELESSLHSLGRDVNFYIYPGTRHWFFEEDRPDFYNPEATKLAWERTIDFLQKSLEQS